MKHNIKYILSVCIGIALTMGLSAQTLNSSYFMEKMTKRNQLNPALRDCHSRRCCGTADAGVGCQNTVLQVKFQQLAEYEAEQHVYLSLIHI